MSSLQAVRALLSKEFELDEAILDASTPFDQLGIDSLTLTECLFMIEDRFDIRLDSTDAAPHTLQELVDMIDRGLAAKRAATSS